MKDIRKTITIEEVAKEAKVSVATVSRVLNKSNLVSKSTAERVHKAVESMGYVPNPLARNLRKSESRTIMIVIPNFTNPYYPHILSGVTEASRSQGYSAMICVSDMCDTEKVLVEMLTAKRIDGAILLSCNRDDEWLKKYVDNFPLVQCSESVENISLPYVAIDNYQAMQDAFDYIQSLGHERIGFVSINNRFISTYLRTKCYYDMLDKMNFHGEPLIREVKDYDFESGRKAALELLSEKNPPTAIACVSDVLALGVIAAANERGLRVPEDISVVGFDDVDYTKIFHPYLTTIRQPCYELGWHSACELQKCIENGKNMDSKIILPHKLMVRESSGNI